MENNKLDNQILTTLRNHPNKDPDPLFIANLRKQLVTDKEVVKKRFAWPKLGVAFSAVMSIFIISVLTLSYFNKSEQGTETPTVEVVKPDPVFEGILQTTPAFQAIYENISTENDLQEQSKVLILYFEGLRTRKDPLIKAGMSNPEDGGELYSRKELYHNVDFSKIELTSIKPEPEKNRYILEFLMVRGEVQQRKTIYLNTTKENAIEDPLTITEWDKEKDLLIAQEVEKIISKVSKGMTKKDADAAFGMEYEVVENTDAEDGTIEDWNYYIFVEEGAEIVKVSGHVDTGNLANQNLGILFNIGWSPDGEALRMIAFYGQSGVVYAKGLNQQGEIDQQLSQ